MIYVYFEADNVQRAIMVVSRVALLPCVTLYPSSGLCCNNSVNTGPMEPPQDVWYGVT